MRESDDEKKYLCLQADRELPVGERRKKDNGKYISEQQTQMCESSAERYAQSRLCRRHRYLPGYCLIPAKPQGVSHAGIKVVTRDELVLRDKDGFFSCRRMMMDLELIRAGVEDARHLWEMQVEAFMELYNKYRLFLLCRIIEIKESRKKQFLKQRKSTVLLIGN